MTTIEMYHQRGIVPRAVLYARFSSDNQREESIEAQLRAQHEYCQRNGIAIVHEFCDRAKSATTDNRPEFLEMINESKNQEFDFVIVHKLDRFARNRYDSAYYRRELRKNGVALISVLENLDDSPESIILEGMLESMAEYYSKNLAREVMKGMKESALRCRHLGGIPLYGYDVDPETKKYIVNPAEAAAVKEIFECVKNGFGYMQIIDRLNAMGCKTKKGLPFGKNSIHEILRNEKYTGVYIFNRATGFDANHRRNNHTAKPGDEILRIPGGMPQIIDSDTFETVSAIIRSRQHTNQHGTAKENYLLAGKIICGECGKSYSGCAKWSGRNKRKHVTYRCTQRKMKGSSICSNKEIRREYIEEFVMREIEKIVFPDDRIESLVESYRKYRGELDGDSEQKLINLKVQLRKNKAQIDNLVSVIAVSGNPSLIEKLTRLEEEKEKIQSEIRDTQKDAVQSELSESDIRRAYQRVREMFRGGTLEEKRQLINLYVDKVVVYREHIEVYLNTVPTAMKANELGGEETIIVKGEPLALYIIKLYRVVKHKKSLQHLHLQVLETFAGGGDESRTRVRKSIHTTFYGCSLLFRDKPISRTFRQADTPKSSVA